MKPIGNLTLDTNVVVDVLNEVSPDECFIAGRPTVKKIAAGANFKTSEYGHKIDLVTSIGLLSGIATLIHFIWLAILEISRKYSEKTDVKSADVSKIILEKIESEKRDDLKDIIKNNPEIFEEIVKSLIKKM